MERSKSVNFTEGACLPPFGTSHVQFHSKRRISNFFPSAIIAVITFVLSFFVWISRPHQITPYEAFVNELLFACRIWITKKPVVESQEIVSLASINSSLTEPEQEREWKEKGTVGWKPIEGKDRDLEKE